MMIDADPKTSENTDKTSAAAWTRTTDRRIRNLPGEYALTLIEAQVTTDARRDDSASVSAFPAKRRQFTTKRRLGSYRNAADRSRRAEYRKRNKARQAELAAQYYETHREEMKAEIVAWQKENPDRVRAISRRQIERHPQKTEARRLMNIALRAGTLVRRPCEVCGNPKSQGHHGDYSKPLDVQWLCSTHHALADRLRRAREQARLTPSSSSPLSTPSTLAEEVAHA